MVAGTLLLALAGCKDSDRDGTRDSKDCAPNDATISPEAKEICDGIDNNCNGQIDEEVALVAYWDRDGDGFGDDESVRRVCVMPPDGVASGGDCDDRDAQVNPDAVEICNEIDDNCDGILDDGATEVFYLDADGDGHGVPDQTIESCFVPPGYTTLDDDCNDDEPAAWTGAEERCDAIDNDCDGEIDEEVDRMVRWEDADGDGYGDPSKPTLACGEGVVAVENALDCNDDDATISPDAAEIVGNAVDEDCDGYLDELGVGGNGDYATLEEALDASNPGDVVQLDDGFFVDTVDLTGHDDITLAGEGCDRTTLWGDGQGTVVTVGSATVENLSIAGGTGTLLSGFVDFAPTPDKPRLVGGGVLVQGDAVLRRLCVSASTATGVNLKGVEDDIGGHGAGIAVIAGAPLLEDVVISGNTSTDAGAGLFVGPETVVHGERLHILGNRVTGFNQSGAVEVVGGELELHASVIAGNTGTHKGAGMRVGPFYLEAPQDQQPEPCDDDIVNPPPLPGDTSDTSDTGVATQDSATGDTGGNGITEYSYVYHPGTATLDNVVFHDNTIDNTSNLVLRGAALIARGGTVDIIDSLITGHDTVASVLSDSAYPLSSCYAEDAGGSTVLKPTRGTISITNVGFHGNAGYDIDGESADNNDPSMGHYLPGRLSGDPLYVNADPDASPGSWDFRLRSISPYRGAGTDGEDIGAYGGFATVPEGLGYEYDTDGDGLTDGYEIHFGLEPFIDDADLDPDGDGATNADEHALETDPFDADTDADGVPDPSDPEPLARWSHGPAAVAPRLVFGLVGEPIPLDATLSSDPQSDPLTATWALTSAPVTSGLSDVDDPSALLSSLTADSAGTYVADVTVSDGAGLDTVGVEVRAVNAVVVPDDYPTVAEAVSVASATTAVALRPGRYEARDVTISGDDVTIIGLGGPDEVILDGQGGGPVLRVEGGAELTLANLTVTGGVSTDIGGGIHCDGAEGIHLYGVVVAYNRSRSGARLGRGGGIHCAAADVTLHDSWLIANEAVEGGGLMVSGRENDSDATVTVDIQRTVFAENRATADGGGMVVWAAGPTRIWMRNNVFVGNRGAVGSAVRTRTGESNAEQSPLMVLQNNAWVRNGDAIPVGNNVNFAMFRLSVGVAQFSGDVTQHNGSSDFVFDVGSVTGGFDYTHMGVYGLLAGNDTGALYDDRAENDYVTDPAVADAGFLDAFGLEPDLYGARPGAAMRDGAPALAKDLDGSPLDYGPCGGPYAPRLCKRIAMDVDGDGLSDGYELAFGLDQGADDAGNDPDGDGLDNAEEQAELTSPIAADTDRDGRADLVDRGQSGVNAEGQPRVPFARAASRAGAPVTVSVADISADSCDILRDDLCLVFAAGDPAAEAACHVEHAECIAALPHSWRVLRAPIGSSITTADLQNLGQPEVTFQPDVPGQYLLELSVEENGAIGTGLVTVTAGRELSVPGTYASIDEAIASAIDGDIIQLDAGTYEVALDIVSRHLTIEGAGRDETILTQEFGTPVTVSNGSDFTLRALTVSRGRGERGGNLACEEATLTLTDVVLRDGIAERGAAGYLDDCITTVTDSDIVANEASNVGAGLYIELGELTYTRGVVTDNRCYNSGDATTGLHFGTDSVGVVRNVVFYDNLAPAGNAGAIKAMSGADVDIGFSTFADNRSTMGAVVRSSGTDLYLHHSIVTGSYGLPATCGLRNITGSIDEFVTSNLGLDNGCNSNPASLAEEPTHVLAAPRYVTKVPADGELVPDLRLRPSSPMRDASSEGLLDIDGSIADFGAFGGPDAPADFDLYAVDTDGDGMADAWEVEFGLDPNTDDSGTDLDGDGLDATTEYALGTDPSSDDTDEDGVIDGIEVSLGDDPLSALDHAPDVDAGPNVLDVLPGTSIDLIGTASDPDGTPSVRWTLIEAPGRSAVTTANLQNADSLVVTIVPDSPGRYELLLEAFEAGGVSSDIAVIFVLGDVLVPEDYDNLDDASRAVSTGYAIDVAAGTWPTNLIVRDDDLRIRGAGRDQTILDGEHLGGVIDINGIGVLELADLTVTGGVAGEGGAVRVQDDARDVVFQSVDFIGNEAVNGGAVHVDRSNMVTMDDVRFLDNGAALNGGGLYANLTDDLQATRVSFAGNIALDEGGAFMARDAHMTWVNGLCVDNQAWRGGCMAVQLDNAEIEVDAWQITAAFNEATNDTDGGSFATATSTGNLRLRNSIVVDHKGEAFMFYAASIPAVDLPVTYDVSYCLVANDDVDLIWGSNVTVPAIGMQIGTAVPQFTDVSDDLDWSNDDYTVVAGETLVEDQGVWIDGYELDGSDPDLGAYGGANGHNFSF